MKGSKRSAVCGAVTIGMISVSLLTGCGHKKNTAAQTSAEALTIQAESSIPDIKAEAAEAAESEAAAKTVTVDLKIEKHKQEGRHMVRAGAQTISVPTSFEGLQKEGAVFSGENEIVKAGATGSCRVQYRGSFGHIRVNVRNNQDEDLPVKDCTIKGIEIGSSEPDPDLTLYGIPMGATRQQVADVYGEPFSKTFDNEKHMSNMVYQFGEDIYSNQVVVILFQNGRAVAASYDDFSLSER